MRNLFNLMVKIKILFDRGKYWFSYLTFFMMIFLTVTSMKQYPQFSFLGSFFWLIVMFVASIIGMLLVGYIEVKHTKAMQKETEYYAGLNPIQSKMFSNQEKIILGINELKKEIFEIKTKK